MHWTGQEYHAFLEALQSNTLLGPDLTAQMFSDQVGDAETVNYPVILSLQEDWHYGFGTWTECHASPHDCQDVSRVSSPGAYGAYPFVDLQHGMWGILARQGELGTFSKGYEVMEEVNETLLEWGSLRCE